ncbi:MAG TPA: hypothetical protein VJY65_12875, partial [Chloroflexota bacterium]|nr:hypothetical protein [Chloroflexota bacterium]
VIVAEAGDEVVGFIYAASCSQVPATASKARVPAAPPLLLNNYVPVGAQTLALQPCDTIAKRSSLSSLTPKVDNRRDSCYHKTAL